MSNNIPNRHGVPWTDKECEQLLLEAKKMPFRDIAEKHQRTVDSIKSQLIKICLRQIKYMDNKSINFDRDNYIKEYSITYGLSFDEINTFSLKTKRSRRSRNKNNNNAEEQTYEQTYQQTYQPSDYMDVILEIRDLLRILVEKK